MSETKSFIWKREWLLGAGSFGSVYKAMNKKTGQIVAVKTFKQNEDSEREAGILKDMEHENIIKLIAHETELETETKVMVMEYCNGRNLFNILKDPENSNGINEKEFLQILHDLSAGIEYMRTKEISHRDLKPDNVMQCFREDGTFYFKIVDFGLAKQVGNNDVFTTFCGALAYMPARDFLAHFGLASHHERTPKFDIRLLGVTLYQLITNQMPFHGVDLNFLIFQKKVLERPENAIAVIQHVPNGPIEYMTTLPKTCLLNLQLCKEMEKILQRTLLENEEKRSTFEEYFQNVRQVMSLKLIPVFYINKCLQTTLCYSDTVSFDTALLELIPGNISKLIMISAGGISGDLIEKPSSDFLQDVSSEKPLLVISVENNSPCSAIHPSLFSEFESWSQKADISSADVIDDVFKGLDLFKLPIAKVVEETYKLCCAAYALMRLIKKVMVIPKYLVVALKSLRSICGDSVVECVVKLLLLKTKLKKLSKKAEERKLSCNSASTDELFNRLTFTKFQHEASIESKLKYFTEFIEELDNHNIEVPKVDCNTVIEEAKTFVNEMLRYYETFKLYEKEGMTTDDLVFIKLDKKNFNAAKEKLVNLAKEILKIVSDYYSQFNNAFSWLHKYILDIKQSKQFMKTLSDEMNNFQSEVGALQWLNVTVDELMILNEQQLAEIMKYSSEEYNKCLERKLRYLLKRFREVLPINEFEQVNSFAAELEAKRKILRDFATKALRCMTLHVEDN